MISFRVNIRVQFELVHAKYGLYRFNSVCVEFGLCAGGLRYTSTGLPWVCMSHIRKINLGFRSSLDMLSIIYTSYMSTLDQLRVNFDLGIWFEFRLS